MPRCRPAKEWTMPLLANFNVFEYHSYDQVSNALTSLIKQINICTVLARTKNDKIQIPLVEPY